MINIILYSIITIILAYLIGSIPTGYIIVKLLKNEDIRTIGSGSTGATNVKRALGKKWFFIVLILDVIKGALPVVLAKIFLPEQLGLYAVLASVAVIIGHSKPIFLQFKGGKSVASGVGTMIALNPMVGLLIGVIWAIITYISKYVSLGSIIAVFLSPFLMFYFKNPIGYVIYCAIAGIYIIYLHRENIKRLLKGEENKVR